MRTKYIKNLSYEESKELISFVNITFPDSYAFFVSHGIAIDHNKDDWSSIINFLENKRVKYQVLSDEAYRKSSGF
jgi:hypothetical protein